MGLSPVARRIGAGVAYVVLAVGIARTLAAYATLLAPYLRVHYGWTLELALVAGQVAFQWAWLARRSWRERVRYAWIVMGVSGLGAVLLVPALVTNAWTPLAPLAALAYFFGVVAIMFVTHWRLVVRAHLPAWTCLTWVVYRLGIVAFVVRTTW